MRQSTELFDERGYAQNGAISVDGQLVVSHSNGNVSYSYTISSAPISGVPLDVTLNYAGSVQFTAFKEFDAGNPKDPYMRWNKFHQNRPAWIVGAGGFAVQVISSNSMFHCDPARFSGVARYNFNDSDMVWLADGYDFCNRMENLLAATESQYGYVDHIRLLRADGSVLELVNKKTVDPNQLAENRSDLYTGHYYVNEANAKGFGVVSYDTVWPAHIQSIIFGALPSGPHYPYYPRILRYYDGSGLEYVFREVVAPYGANAYAGRGLNPTSRFGNIMAGATIFYLEEINSNSGQVTAFKRSRHYYPREVVTLNEGNIFDPVFTSILDSTVGRALTTDFGEISIGYGDVGMTIQAYGRTTKVRFAKIHPSGNAGSATSMPLATRGYFTPTAAHLANLPETGNTSKALYDSYIGYVTEIADPEGRITTFEYEPYTRTYIDYNFPIENQSGHDVSLTCKNYRLKKVVEPTCSYTISYAPGNFMQETGVIGRVDNTRNDTLRPNDGSLSHAFLQNNVASYVKKYDRSNTLLTTMECEYLHDPDDGFFQGAHRTYDNITGKVRTSTQVYVANKLTDPVPYVPIPQFTELRTSTDSGDVESVTTTFYDHPAHTTYLWLPSEQTTVVAGITKSRQTFSYQYDTARTYGGDANLAAKFGIEVKKHVVNTLDPATNVPLLRDTTEYTHLTLVDTNLTRLDTVFLKLKTLENWFAMRDTLGLRWEDAMYDPRVMVFEIDSAVGDNTLPPIYGMVKRQVSADATGYIIGGREFEYTAAGATPHYLNDLMFRGTLLRDWRISAGGAMTIRNDSNIYTRGWGRNLLATTINANGASQRFYYDGYSSPKLRRANGEYKAVGRVTRNDDTKRDTLLPHGGYFSFAFEKPLVSEGYVRKYSPSNLSGGPLVDTMLQLNQYTFYGLLSGMVDQNGNYSQYRYDNNGRVLAIWAPFDFPRPDTADTVEYEGTAAIPLIGYTEHDYTVDTLHCDSAKLYGGPPVTDRLTNLYAGHNASDLPGCPCPPQVETREKGGGRSILESCNVHRQFVNNDYFTGVIEYKADSASPLVAATAIDSAFLVLHPMNAIGECVLLVVEIPEFSFSRSYVFNCDSGVPPAGATAILSGEDHLEVDLSFIISDLLAMTPGASFTVLLHVPTVGGGVEFINGVDAEDTRPQLLLHGSFAKASDLVDYTLAYSYDDDSLKATVSAKVDDIRHTSNHYDLAGQNGATVRRTSATNHFGADGRVLRSEVAVRTHGAVRIDSVRHTYAGNGAKLSTIDQEGDTIVTRFDALNRPVEIINADGTHTTIAYAIGTPASFGVTDQDFHGFCSAKTVTNENGTKVVEYYDAFDRLRRQVVDSGASGAHLNLTTRYNYNTQGRLSEIITPKGDTIGYWYDIWGRVQQKKQADLGVVSYAYDNLGNVRFVQNEEQAQKGRILFNQYDDLNRLVVVGEAVLGTDPNRPAFEDDGYEGEGGWLHGHVYTPDFRSEAKKKGRNASILSGPINRVTDQIDATILHIDSASGSMPVTANPTLWASPQSQVPATWSLAQSLYSSCALPADTTFLTETNAPLGPLLRHPVTFHVSPSGPGAGFGDFEDLAKYPHFARMAISYDTLPYRSGPVWGNFPAHEQWDSLTLFNRVRNTKGREAAIAYREHGGEPWHYMVTSYDERGRVEALLRWTENIGFDAVYYRYNSMNQVTSVRVADFDRQYQTWYGYDHNGRVDSIWAKLADGGAGLVSGGSTSGTWHYRDTLGRPLDAEIVYAYTKSAQVDTMRYPKVGVLVDYAYNHRKWPDSLVAWQITGGGSIPVDTTMLWKQVLEYDPAGQITGQVSLHDGVISYPAQQYEYDRAHRLTKWKFSPDSTLYTYDKAGNRTLGAWGNSVNGDLRNTTQTYGGAVGGVNRLAETVTRDEKDDIVLPGRYTYAFDANGGIVMKSHHPYNGIGGDNQEYAYSYRGLMRRLATGGWDTMKYEHRYRFSPAGEREQKRMYFAPRHDSVVNYPWVYYLLGTGREQLAVYHGQQTSNDTCGESGRRVYMYPAEYLTYGIGGNASLTVLPTHQKRYVIADHLGSARVVLDSGGMVVGRYDYEPFGGAMELQGAVTGPRKSYIDREEDAESGLRSTGARQLDRPRFTSVDPMWEKIPGASPYIYSLNNPVGLIDDGGEFPYTFIVRSFHPSNSFSGGFSGDARGFSAAYIINSRVNQYVTLETADGSLAGRTYSDPSHHPLLGTRTANPEWSLSDRAETSLLPDGSTTHSFSAEYASALPLVPSPDIDVQSGFLVSENLDEGYIDIQGTITGDRFPNAEALVADSKQQTIFLGAFTRPDNSSPARNLPGKGTDLMLKVSIRITIDKNGNFTGVIAGGKRYTVATWNLMFTSKNAHPNEKAWEE